MNGYVYILINESMPGLLKIGKTKRDSRARARELSNTSIPTKFQVAFETYSDDCSKLEKEIHLELDDFRVSQNREFFKYPLDKAIALVQKQNSPAEDEESIYSAVDISNKLRLLYPDYLKPDIVAVRIVQPEDCVWLEITTEEFVGGDLRDQTIKRTDLGFIGNGDGDGDEDSDDLFFNVKNSVFENARRFAEEFDPYSIIMTTDLFHEKACKEIDLEYRNSLNKKS